MTAPLCVVREVHKSFGPTRALDGVSIEARAGEVHALLGENGAGKSTLMAILAGAIEADRGSVELAGEPFRPGSPDEARRRGVAIVYQEPPLCPHLTVAENVLLGVEPVGWRLFVDRREARRRAEAVLAQITGEPGAIDPAAVVAELSPGNRQLVAIARALALEARVLILDEPTSSLGAADTARLFEVVRRLRGDGLCVLYISHFLEEVQRVADRYTVLRDGRTVASGAIADTTVDGLVAAMVGREVAAAVRRGPRQAGEVVLEVKDVAGKRLPREASLELRRGEVLGVAGLVGAGRTELCRLIFGLDPVRAGTVRVGAVLGAASPARRLAQGVGLCSEDRKGEGLAASMTLGENLLLSRMPAWSWPSRERAAAAHWIERLGIKCQGPDQPVSALSGGNQQKVALARLLHHDVDVALLDEPTRGIDVTSRAEIYRLIDELAARGKAVLVVSSYLPELFALCDRVAVMRRGRLGPARPLGELSEHAILVEATGT